MTANDARLRYAAHLLARTIETDPDKRSGIPVINGSKMTVAEFLAELAEGQTPFVISHWRKIPIPKMVDLLEALSICWDRPAKDPLEFAGIQNAEQQVREAVLKEREACRELAIAVYTANLLLHGAVIEGDPRPEVQRSLWKAGAAREIWCAISARPEP